MSFRKTIIFLLIGMCFAASAHAQDEDDSLAMEMNILADTALAKEAADTMVEVRDFNGQTRQYRWKTAMWDKQKLGEWDEMANTRLSLRRVPAATMDELHKMKALQYELEADDNRSAFMQRLGLWIVANIRFIRNAFYILLGALFLLTIILFIRKSDLSFFSRSSRGSHEEAGATEETGPLNYDALAQSAIAAGDYRSAIRMRYLQALHILQAKELIAPGKDKTNMDFLRELSTTAFYQPFAALTRHYEYTWYGKVPLNNGQFTQLDEQFAEFKKSLR